MARTETYQTTPATAAAGTTAGARRDGGLQVELASNGQAVGALVTGMIAATLGFLVISAPAAILLGLAAVVLGISGIAKANRTGGLLKGTAVSGLVSGLLGLLLGIAVVVGGVTLFNEAQDDSGVQQQIEALQQEVERLSVN
jgi:hypothetical protein